MNATHPTDRVLSDEGMLRRVFGRYYFSSMLAILCSCIGSIVGNIVVGNTLGGEKLAVMSLVLPVYYVFATVGNLAGIGGSALCGTLVGQRRMEDCKKAFTATYILTVGLCVLFSIAFLLLLPVLIPLLGTPAELTEDVRSYAVIMIVGGTFTAGMYLSFNFLRMDGKGVATTATFGIMAGLNVVLDILLAPMGVAGVSLATSVGAASATVFGIVMLRKSETLCFVRLDRRELLSFSGQVFRIGSPGATENASILLKSYFFNQMIVAMVGAGALSSLSVVNSVNSIAQAITVGCAGALVPLVSVFSAERDTVSIRRTVKSSVTVSMLILAGFMAVVMVFAPTIARLFGMADGSGETVLALRLFCLSLPLSLLSNVIIYLHLSNEHTAIANVLTALRCLGYIVGAAFLLMKLTGEVGLWLSFLACDALTLATAAVLHFFARRKNPDLTGVLLLDGKYEKNGACFAICTDDSNEGIAHAIEDLQKFCDQHEEISPKRAMLITLSMDEMCHMAAEFSTCHSQNHLISIRVLLHQDVLILRLRYDGDCFNPIEYYEQKKNDMTDLDAMLELADCLGIKMVIDACDVVDYRTTFGINNLTILL